MPTGDEMYRTQNGNNNAHGAAPTGTGKTLAAPLLGKAGAAEAGDIITGPPGGGGGHVKVFDGGRDVGDAAALPDGTITMSAVPLRSGTQNIDGTLTMSSYNGSSFNLVDGVSAPDSSAQRAGGDGHRGTIELDSFSWGSTSSADQPMESLSFGFTKIEHQTLPASGQATQKSIGQIVGLDSAWSEFEESAWKAAAADAAAVQLDFHDVGGRVTTISVDPF